MENEPLFYNAIVTAFEGDHRRIAKFKKNFLDWESAYTHLPADIPQIEPEKEWRDLERAGLRLILRESDEYPTILKEIPHAPFGLYLLGTLPDATRDCIAIVGTRRGTPEGKNITGRFARELAGAGFTIVSGLALGIDAAAHVGCLEAKGSTIAILASGLDLLYPQTNEQLAHRILDSGGAIISEYPLGSPPLPYRFLERNRIVSGISKGVLVVESPKRSGSLATARFALEQNRDVFVVPGSITHSNFFGSHELIRQGAELVTKPDDVLASYGIMREDVIANEENGASPEEKLILQALRTDKAPLDIDKIISMTRLEPRIANQALTFLLLKNLIKETESGYTI